MGKTKQCRRTSFSRIDFMHKLCASHINIQYTTIALISNSLWATFLWWWLQTTSSNKQRQRLSGGGRVKLSLTLRKSVKLIIRTILSLGYLIAPIVAVVIAIAIACHRPMNRLLFVKWWNEHTHNRANAVWAAFIEPTHNELHLFDASNIPNVFVKFCVYVMVSIRSKR